jgi:hypothetical protein
MILLTPLCKMPPKHCQLCAPYPKASGNTFQALVDPPHDGNNLAFDGVDKRTNRSDNNTIIIMNPYNSELLVSQQYCPMSYPIILNTTIQDWLVKTILNLEHHIDIYMRDDAEHCITVDNRVCRLKAN